MIQVDRVSLAYEREGAKKAVLDDVSLELAGRSSCAVIGPSGCGKTSLLFLLAGLLRPDSGEIRIDATLRRTTILQNYGLFPWKTVSQNIALGLLLQKRKKKVIEARVEELLCDMELQGFGDHFPVELSGGMQQRVALARALAPEPQILLMDEPLSSLDALTRERLQNLIVAIWQKNRISMVLVTHSIEEAVYLGRQIIVLGNRPARVLQNIANPEAGSTGYRQSDAFFHRCTEIRRILGGVANGQ